MARCIALLRGINLGAKRKVLMADLRELFRGLNFSDVKTYIQTGNVVFNSNHSENHSTLAQKIEQSIYSQYQFEVPVMIRTSDEIHEIISNNPFIEKEDVDLERYHVTLLKDTPEPEVLEKIQDYDFSPDKFIIKDQTVYVFCAGRYQDTKLGNTFFEKKLKVRATTRNWKTLLKLSELSQSTKKTP